MLYLKLPENKIGSYWDNRHVVRKYRWHLGDYRHFSPEVVQPDVPGVDSVDDNSAFEVRQSEQSGDERRLPGPCSPHNTYLEIGLVLQ